MRSLSRELIAFGGILKVVPFRFDYYCRRGELLVNLADNRYQQHKVVSCEYIMRCDCHTLTAAVKVAAAETVRAHRRSGLANSALLFF